MVEAYDVERLKTLLASITPGWCGAMVSAFAIRRNSTLSFGEEGQANEDVETAKRLADAMPSIKALLARIAELEEALGLTSGYLEEAANVVEGNGLPQLAGLLRNQLVRARATLERDQAEGEG